MSMKISYKLNCFSQFHWYCNKLHFFLCNFEKLALVAFVGHKLKNALLILLKQEKANCNLCKTNKADCLESLVSFLS